MGHVIIDWYQTGLISWSSAKSGLFQHFKALRRFLLQTTQQKYRIASKDGSGHYDQSKGDVSKMLENACQPGGQVNDAKRSSEHRRYGIYAPNSIRKYREIPDWNGHTMGPMPVPDMTSFQQAERRQPAVGEISYIDCIVFPPTGTGAGTKTQSNIEKKRSK